MTNLIVLLVAVLLVGAYWLGYGDGKMKVQEDWLFERLDACIAKIRAVSSGE